MRSVRFIAEQSAANVVYQNSVADVLADQAPDLHDVEMAYRTALAEAALDYAALTPNQAGGTGTTAAQTTSWVASAAAARERDQRVASASYAFFVDQADSNATVTDTVDALSGRDLFR